MYEFFKKILKENDRKLKRIKKIADKVENYANFMKNLKNSDLINKTFEFKNRYKNGEKLEKILPEAFAVVRETARRIIGLYPYYVQIMGAIVLHEGNIAEMKTGEGKTLTATMAVYLNALSGKSVHLVTVNEYLALRDFNEMGKLYKFLGLTVGLNISNISLIEKKKVYNCDILYSTNSEICFDYLRDNMAVSKEQIIIKDLDYVIIDEIDSILIDEARTPLIISEQCKKSDYFYIFVNNFVKNLKFCDYKIDIQFKTINLTESGIIKAEKNFELDNLYDIKNVYLTHYIDQALRAHYIMIRDVDYVLKKNKILIVDQFTGRIMEDRRYSDGLHQAIEAKENVQIEDESKTMATITLQNFFRMYKKISGMTGTAYTEEEEFQDIYNMNVIQIPTNKKMIREDKSDIIFPTLKSKFAAIINEIKKRYLIGQPVLVGTVSIEVSEIISNLLVKEKIKHEVLNAKNNFKEAEIIMKAGKFKAVTIATNMAGRGTDIKLSKNVIKIGGLFVIGTERHESRRIDNQLRGRSGRQGDPGISQFYLSLEDDLLKRFGSKKILSFFKYMKINEKDAIIQSKILSKQIESAQKRVEGNNYDARRTVIQYDDVIHEQRDIIYKERKDIIFERVNLKKVIVCIIKKIIRKNIEKYTIVNKNWNFKAIFEFINVILFNKNVLSIDKLKSITSFENIIVKINLLVDKFIENREKLVNDNLKILNFEKNIILKIVDIKWQNHIDIMENLRNSVSWRSYGQNDPLVEYQTEGYKMFNNMINYIEFDIMQLFMKSKIN